MLNLFSAIVLLASPSLFFNSHLTSYRGEGLRTVTGPNENVTELRESIEMKWEKVSQGSPFYAWSWELTLEDGRTESDRVDFEVRPDGSLILTSGQISRRVTLHSAHEDQLHYSFQEVDWNTGATYQVDHSFTSANEGQTVILDLQVHQGQKNIQRDQIRLKR